MDAGSLIPASGAIRELQPAYPIDVSRQTALNPNPLLPTQDSILREYLRVLIKRKWVVVSSLALIFSVVAIATLRSTRIFRASGSIAINKVDPAMMNIGNTANGGAEYYYDPTDLDTEVSILRSDLLALQVIKALNLDKRPELGGSR